MKCCKFYLSNLTRYFYFATSLPGSHAPCPLKRHCLSLLVHYESKKLDPYSFEHNFCKYCPILILFFYCCRQKLSAQKPIIEFPTSPIVCCCTTLQNATAYTSSQKLLNQSAIHAVISLLSQSRKF